MRLTTLLAGVLGMALAGCARAHAPDPAKDVDYDLRVKGTAAHHPSLCAALLLHDKDRRDHRGIVATVRKASARFV